MEKISHFSYLDYYLCHYEGVCFGLCHRRKGQFVHFSGSNVGTSGFVRTVRKRVFLSISIIYLSSLRAKLRFFKSYFPSFFCCPYYFYFFYSFCTQKAPIPRCLFADLVFSLSFPNTSYSCWRR